jgi:hypothetical protein
MGRSADSGHVRDLKRFKLEPKYEEDVFYYLNTNTTQLRHSTAHFSKLIQELIVT